MMETPRIQIRPRSVQAKEFLSLWISIGNQVVSIGNQMKLTLLEHASRPSFFSGVLPGSPTIDLNNKLSAVLKDVLPLHEWIPSEGASSRLLRLFLAQIESAIAALAEAEGAWRKAASMPWRLSYYWWRRLIEAMELIMAACKRVESQFTSLTHLVFELMRTELDFLPFERDLWAEFEEENVQVYAVVVSAVALLLLVYHYLAGYIDRGGTKTYSSGSLDYRSTYVSIVLFRGAYVWIKFRDVASSKRGGYRRPVTDKLSGTIKLSAKPEARYRPPRESGDSSYIYLGLCATDEEAEVKKQIAAYCFGRHSGRLNFDNGSSFLIPPMLAGEEQGLSVAGKRAWVKNKVMEVYEHIKASIDMNAVRLVEQTRAHPSSALPALTSAPVSEGPPGIAIDPEVVVEGHLPPLSEGASDADIRKLPGTLLDSSEVMCGLPNADPPQHLQGDHVRDLAVLTFDNQCDPLIEFDPPWTWDSNLTDVHGTSEVAVGSLPIEDASHIPQAQAAGEFQTMGSVGPQQHSDAVAVMSDTVTPSAIELKLHPGNSTSDGLALKMINLLMQQIQEKDKRIVELERENERLRGASQY